MDQCGIVMYLDSENWLKASDGVTFSQMLICHMDRGGGKRRFGIYACAPEESSFKAVFSNMEIMECQWKAHDGQQPDNNG